MTTKNLLLEACGGNAVTDRWLSVSEARRNLPLHVKDAALGKTRFIVFRVNSRGKLHQYKAALIAYEDFQHLTARENVAALQSSAAGTGAVPADGATAVTPRPATFPPTVELFAEHLHRVSDQDRIAAEHIQGG